MLFTVLFTTHIIYLQHNVISINLEYVLLNYFHKLGTSFFSTNPSLLSSDLVRSFLYYVLKLALLIIPASSSVLLHSLPDNTLSFTFYHSSPSHSFTYCITIYIYLYFAIYYHQLTPPSISDPHTKSHSAAHPVTHQITSKHTHTGHLLSLSLSFSDR